MLTPTLIALFAAPTHAVSVDRLFSSLQMNDVVKQSDDEWVDGKATYYGDDSTAGHACSDITNQWANSRAGGFHAAPAAHIFYDDRAPQNRHGWQCGRCMEVQGVNATTATGHVNEGATVQVLVTNLCPEQGHCHAGSNHLDLSPKAFQVLATQQSGVIRIRWRYVPCTMHGEPAAPNAKLIIKSNAHRWNFQFAAVDLAGNVQVTGMAVKRAGEWKDADVAYGGAFGCANSPTSCGPAADGPVEFKVFTTGGELRATVPSITGGTYDFDGNIGGSGGGVASTPGPASTPVSAPSTPVTPTPSSPATPAPSTPVTPAPSTPAPSTPEGCLANWADCTNGQACCGSLNCVKHDEYWSQCLLPPDDQPCVGEWDDCTNGGHCCAGLHCVEHNQWWRQCLLASNAKLKALEA